MKAATQIAKTLKKLAEANGNTDEPTAKSNTLANVLRRHYHRDTDDWKTADSFLNYAECVDSDCKDPGFVRNVSDWIKANWNKPVTKSKEIDNMMATGIAIAIGNRLLCAGDEADAAQNSGTFCILYDLDKVQPGQAIKAFSAGFKDGDEDEDW